MGPAGACPGAQGWAQPAQAQERRDGPRQRRPRSAGRPPLGKPCALAQCLHRPQPLPTGRVLLDFPCICTRRHNRFSELGDALPLDEAGGDSVPLDETDGNAEPLDQADGDTVPLEDGDAVPLDEANDDPFDDAVRSTFRRLAY